jgi:hypothetical protein
VKSWRSACRGLVRGRLAVRITFRKGDHVLVGFAIAFGRFVTCDGESVDGLLVLSFTDEPEADPVVTVVHESEVARLESGLPYGGSACSTAN